MINNNQKVIIDMAKKDAKKDENKPDYEYSKNKKIDKDEHKTKIEQELMIPEGLPKEAEEKLKLLKKDLEKFKEKLLKKFEEYVIGISLLPPPKPVEGQHHNKDDINVLVLVDDHDSTRMSKFELKDKLQAIIIEMGTEVNKNLKPQSLLLSELWTNCYDAKYDTLELIAQGAIVFDKGMLAAIKISEIHKQMVLKKFEKYIVCYVLGGSLVQGKATPSSDIDVWLVIDDTDVKKMTRAELKDRLRQIILGMGMEAGQMTGIMNKINIQTWILTDFWDGIREANPVYFTLLRDGVPFYDRGIFMPWKQLLRMGKIKPSPEAIDMSMSSGEQLHQRVQLRINEIGMEDIFYAILMPSQAAIMLYGLPPPTPKETPQIIREIFVDKEKMLEEKYVKTLEKVIKVRKDLEHGDIKAFSGSELDELLKASHEYLHRINKLFTSIDVKKEAEDVIKLYEDTVTIVRDAVMLDGVKEVGEQDLQRLFDKHVVSKGFVPQKCLRILKSMLKVKDEYKNGKITKTEVLQIKKDAKELIKIVVEYVQLKRGKELEKAKIRVKYGDRFGDIFLLGEHAYIIRDIDKHDGNVEKARITEHGGLESIKTSTSEEFEKAIMNLNIPPKVFIREKIFEDLKQIFGEKVEVLINY